MIRPPHLVRLNLIMKTVAASAVYAALLISTRTIAPSTYAALTPGKTATLLLLLPLMLTLIFTMTLVVIRVVGGRQRMQWLAQIVLYDMLKCM